MPNLIVDRPKQAGLKKSIGDQFDQIPTRSGAFIHFLKATALQLDRAIKNYRDSIKRHPQDRQFDFSVVLAQSSSLLWTDFQPSELWYQRGKIQNLRIAASRLHQCVIPAHQIFSFWMQVGRASALRGFVRGRMLQEGCLIPAIGGGICQLSNALYQAALEAGCEIIERHPHSRIVPGSATASGRDATVAWNYIDLRFRSKQALQIKVTLTRDHLQVSLNAQEASRATREAPAQQISEPPRTLPILDDHSCESCGRVTCFRSDHRIAHAGKNKGTAFVLDAALPEFVSFVRDHHCNQDMLLIPLNGEKCRQPRYAWPTSGFEKISTAAFATVRRSHSTRKLAAQGAERQQALLHHAELLARKLAEKLNPSIDEVFVSQSLVPFLWNSGALGGRSFHIFADRLPARLLQAKLDDALRAHPESQTLGDFRAENWLLDAEDAAFENAEQIITPHALVASRYSAKSTVLDWSIPKAQPRDHGKIAKAEKSILFTSSTLGRKGAYELRQALRGIEVKLFLGGRILEQPDFWSGFNVESFEGQSLDGIDLAVQPSIVESQPRGLLRAIAHGVPAIATPECGIPCSAALDLVPALNSVALCEKILALLSAG